MTALAGVTIDDLRLVGTDRTAEVAHAITATELVLSIEQASTLTLTLHDPRLTLLRSGLFSARVTVALDGVLFELASVVKSATSSLRLTFEDAAVSDLRRRTGERKAAAGTISRSSFARQLVAEVPWIAFEAPASDTTKVEIARGVPADGSDQPAQNTWETLDEIAQAIGWRRFARSNVVVFTSDVALMAKAPVATLAEYRDGVDTIDYEYDAGQTVATATVSARAGRWDIPPGSVVTLTGLGPADGPWLVAEVRRSLSSVLTTIALIQPQPTLAEPEPDAGTDVPAGAPASYVEQGPFVPLGSTSSAGLAWPSAGRVTSVFGAPRSAGLGKVRKHQGIDIAAATGTAIVAPMAGTVAFAGTASGYGSVVYVDHEGGFQTRSAHMSRITVRAGQKVTAGQKVGEVGSTGNSTGPHNHFEVRRNGVPIDPLSVLPKR